MQPRLVKANDKPHNQVMTDLDLTQAVGVVRANPNNSRFALDLVADYDRSKGRLSQSKENWLIVIAAQILERRSRPPAPSAVVGDVSGILGMFHRAGKRLKFPKVELDTADGRTVVLALAGSRSQYAGQVNVTSGHKYGDPAGRFYGRVALDGTTQVGDSGVLDLLRRFAADPAGVAAEYGRRSGQCCYCGLQLTDDRSLAVGYGPHCADSWGMPYPTRMEFKAGWTPRGAEAEVAAAERENRPPALFGDPAEDEELLTLDELLARVGAERVDDRYRLNPVLVGSERDDD